MGSRGSGSGSSGPIGKPVAVVNRANQPREFRIRGRFVKWAPGGRPGSVQSLTAEEAASADFRRALKYLSIVPERASKPAAPAIKEATDA